MFLNSLDHNMCFFAMIYLGLIVGIVYEITCFICKIAKNNKVVRSFFDVIVVFLAFVLFFLAINTLGNGYFRLFFVVGYALGIYLEKISLGFLVAKICLFVYNNSIKVLTIIRRKKI